MYFAFTCALFSSLAGNSEKDSDPAVVSCIGSDCISSTCLMRVLFRTTRTMIWGISAVTGVFSRDKCYTGAWHKWSTTVEQQRQGWEEEAKWEREINISTCFSREKDITRGAQLVQTFQSLHNIFSSTQKQQMNCIKRSNSYSSERNIVSISSFQSLIKCKKLNTVSLYSENNSLDETGWGATLCHSDLLWIWPCASLSLGVV